MHGAEGGCITLQRVLSECTTLKHVVPGKHVISVLFLVTLLTMQMC